MAAISDFLCVYYYFIEMKRSFLIVSSILDASAMIIMPGQSSCVKTSEELTKMLWFYFLRWPQQSNDETTLVSPSCQARGKQDKHETLIRLGGIHQPSSSDSH